MKTVNIHEAKTTLSALLVEVAAGTDIVIARAGKPVARLTSYHEEKPAPRPMGFDDGLIWISPDFDAPLPDEILRGFVGGPEAE